MSSRSLGRVRVMVLSCMTTLAAACSPPAPVTAPPVPTATANPITTNAAENAPPIAAGASKSCKVAQVYESPTSVKGSSWAHEQAFLATKKELPWVDLSIRQESVPSSNKQALDDVIESMVQQGANAVYTTSPSFMESTRTVAARHPDVAFFNALGVPGKNEPLNVSYYNATIEEGRYLTGEVAGLAVEPGANLGFVASQPTPEVFRGENAFALGVMQTNPTAKIYNRWTLTRYDPNLEKQAAESLLGAPINASLLSQHQDSPATQLAAQAAGKLGIGFGVDMNDAAPQASLTSPTWNWTDYYKYTIPKVCPGGTWLFGGKANPPWDYRYWMGSFQDGTVQTAPLNMAALANHPRKNQIQKLYNDEVAAFKEGEKSFQSIFTGPIQDNAGKVRIEDIPDIGALYDDRAAWFAANIVGAPNP